eukprot:CFRG4220T1
MGNGYSLGGVIFGQMFKARQFISEYKGPQVPDDVDLSNKTFVVTGCSSGLGKILVKDLALKGAKVHLVSRSTDKLESVKAEVEKAVADAGQQCGGLFCHSLDVSDVNQVNKFCQEFPKDPVHCLVNNAGALPTVREMVSDGKLEKTVACHVVGPYLLANGLYEQLKASGDGRVVNNASAGLYSAQMDVNALKHGFKKFASKKDNKVDGALVYAIAKRSMLEMSDYMAEKYKSDNIVVMTTHPGWCETPGLKPLREQHSSYSAITFRDPEDGAKGMFYLCASPDICAKQSGEFFFDGKVVEKHQPFARTNSSEKDIKELISFLDTFLPTSSTTSVEP